MWHWKTHTGAVVLPELWSNLSQGVWFCSCLPPGFQVITYMDPPFDPSFRVAWSITGDKSPSSTLKHKAKSILGKGIRVWFGYMWWNLGYWALHYSLFSMETQVFISKGPTDNGNTWGLSQNKFNKTERIRNVYIMLNEISDYQHQYNYLCLMITGSMKTGVSEGREVEVVGIKRRSSIPDLFC